MTVRPRTRNDPRREAMRKALITAAETLFSEEGVRAVTVRQIAASVKSANNNVVSYHFGGKDALIDAVFTERLPELEQRRGEILAAGNDADEGTVRLRFLIEALWRPLFEAVNDKGRRGYARFLRAVMVEGQGQRLGRIDMDYEHSLRIRDEMVRLLPEAMAGHFQWRLATTTFMVLDAICLAEEPVLATPDEAELLFDKALDMAVAALLA